VIHSIPARFPKKGGASCAAGYLQAAHKNVVSVTPREKFENMGE